MCERLNTCFLKKNCFEGARYNCFTCKTATGAYEFRKTDLQRWWPILNQKHGKGEWDFFVFPLWVHFKGWYQKKADAEFSPGCFARTDSQRILLKQLWFLTYNWKGSKKTYSSLKKCPKNPSCLWWQNHRKITNNSAKTNKNPQTPTKLN